VCNQREMGTLKVRNAFLLLVLLLAVGAAAWSQALPSTAGKTLTGKRLVVAEAVRGHAAVLVASFSKDAGPGCDEWARTLRADPALAGVAVYQLAMLEQAPGFIRGTIENGMRKGLSAAQQDSYAVLTADEKLWRAFLDVGTEKEAYVTLLDASGKVRWHGHGAARDLEPLVRAALK